MTTLPVSYAIQLHCIKKLKWINYTPLPTITQTSQLATCVTMELPYDSFDECLHVLGPPVCRLHHLLVIGRLLGRVMLQNNHVGYQGDTCMQYGKEKRSYTHNRLVVTYIHVLGLAVLVRTANIKSAKTWISSYPLNQSSSYMVYKFVIGLDQTGLTVIIISDNILLTYLHTVFRYPNKNKVGAA